MNKTLEHELEQLWYKYGIRSEIIQTGFTDEVSCFVDPDWSLPRFDVCMRKHGINGTQEIVSSFTHTDSLTYDAFYPKINKMVADLYAKTCKADLLVGVKGFNYDWTCRGLQYEVGKTYTQDELPRVCQAGFHFCADPMDCLTYYSPVEGSKYALVIAEDAFVDADYEGGFCFNSKFASNKIKIVCDITDAFLRSGLMTFFIVRHHNLLRETKTVFYRDFCETVGSQHPEVQYYLAQLWKQACNVDRSLAFSDMLGWDSMRLQYNKVKENENG